MATRLEEEKGVLSFENSYQGINQFLAWLKQIAKGENLILGITSHQDWPSKEQFGSGRI